MVHADILEILLLFKQLLPEEDKHWFNNRVEGFAALWRVNRRQGKGRRFTTWTFVPLNKEFRSKVAAAHWCNDNFPIVHFGTGTPPPSSDSESE